MGAEHESTQGKSRGSISVYKHILASVGFVLSAKSLGALYPIEVRAVLTGAING
jgi:hypothetical protein